MQKMVNPTGEAVCDTYKVSAEYGGCELDKSSFLTLNSSDVVTPDTLIKSDLIGVVDVHSLKMKPTIFARLARKPQRTYEWAFDRNSLEAISYSTIALAESNLCSLFDLLSQAGDDRSLDLIESFATHPMHFVRWKAVQAIGSRDAARGMIMARGALTDQHPDVREAARATVEGLQF
jgi:hypothetical protein